MSRVRFGIERLVFLVFVAFTWVEAYMYPCKDTAVLPSHGGRRTLVAEQTLSHQKAGSEKRSYSVAEAAEILGVSKRSIYNLCAHGAFKSVRIGTRLRISKKSFDDWLDGGSNQI